MLTLNEAVSHDEINCRLSYGNEHLATEQTRTETRNHLMMFPDLEGLLSISCCSEIPF